MKLQSLSMKFLAVLILITILCTAPIAQTSEATVVQIPVEVISPKAPLSVEEKPIEIEIRKSSEVSRIEGCKDLCGDGICQEIVCMAIGCPCPETLTSCPTDCRTPTPAVQPVVAFPAEAKVEIDPTKENPISVNDMPIEFKTEEQSPKVYVEVKTAMPVPSAVVTISVDKESKLIRIEHENTTAITQDTIKVEDNGIKVETPKGYAAVNVLPAVATQVAVSRVSHEIKKIELKVLEEKPVYETVGERKARLLWLIPVTLSVKTTIDAQTGRVAKVEQPWWSFLTV